MKIESTGAPILAKQNPALYWFIVIALAATVLAFLLYFIIKRINAWITSPGFIESHKKVCTTKKNIKTMARKASLTNTEAQMLWLICKTYKTPNIVFQNKDEKAMDELFRKHYTALKKLKNSEEKIGIFFSLLYKMEHLRNQDCFIRSSKSLTAGQEVYYKDKDGFNWTFFLQKNTSQGIFLEIPKMLFTSDKQPRLMTRFVLTVKTSEGLAYTMQTRALRYEEALDGTHLLVIKQANTLEPIQRRKYKRIDIKENCIFTEVEPRAVKASDNSKNYAILGQNFRGVINNISSTGCSLTGTTDIMAGHYVLVKFQLNGNEKEAAGVILSTTKDLLTNNTSYHIKFTDIQLSTKNSIYAYVYGYSVENQQTKKEEL